MYTCARAMAHGQWCVVLAACLMAATASSASAAVLRAGGTGEWRVPGHGNGGSYNNWAEHTRFRVGDAIAFSYQPGNDSVLLVDKKAYDACDTATPVDTFADGNTVFTFTRSGAFYFISGVKDNCNRNEKMIVVVMGGHATNGTATRTTAMAPSPDVNGAGAFSPPFPPPPFGIEISPSGEPAPNAAPTKAVGVAVTAALAIGTLFYALV